MIISWKVGCEKSHGKPKNYISSPSKACTLPHCQVENSNLSLHIRASSVLLEHCSDPNQHEMECYSSIGAYSSL